MILECFDSKLIFLSAVIQLAFDSKIHHPFSGVTVSGPRLERVLLVHLIPTDPATTTASTVSLPLSILKGMDANLDGTSSELTAS